MVWTERKSFYVLQEMSRRKFSAKGGGEVMNTTINHVARAVRIWVDMQPTKMVCEEAANHITTELIEAGIDAVTIKGFVWPPNDPETNLTHYWTEANGYVIDVTIDQLGPEWPNIYIVKKEETTAIYHDWERGLDRKKLEFRKACPNLFAAT